jgi:hypothetical protein
MIVLALRHGSQIMWRMLLALDPDLGSRLSQAFGDSRLLSSVLLTRAARATA